MPSSVADRLDRSAGIWSKLIQMLSGGEVLVSAREGASLVPPLEVEGAVALPEAVDWLPDPEQNRAVYRFLALQLAGRREFGTHAALARVPAGQAELYLLAEAVRVQTRIALAYPGAAREAAPLTAALLEAWQHGIDPSRGRVLDVLLACVLAGQAPPAWLPIRRPSAERALRLLATLARADAKASDSLAVAGRLVATLGLDGAALAPDEDNSDDGDPPPMTAGGPADADGSDAAESAGVLQPSDADQPAEGRADAGAGEPGQGDSLEPSDADASAVEANGSDATPRPLRQVPKRAARTYDYDEWDYTVGHYRKRHCRVHELALAGDEGAFFEGALKRNAPLLLQVRRHFERIRPERYRIVRGLEDGEDFDLDALTEARIESRARRTPSTRVYTARTKQARDVATLFLLDMSASTDQPYAEPGDPPVRTIIETLKEALVVMSSALDDLGDSYAIYGFSSQGNRQVEVFPVKAFEEPLSRAVKARIGGIAPKHGTRMGAALRHMVTKLARSHARSKHLILLSDGYPQDAEYGPDRRTYTYGVKDTAVALREVTAAGTIPFCITVDRAGNDYLREMCDEAQYLIIDDLQELPRELPKIYRRVVS